MLVCFDIDGTLANCEHRLPHIKNKPKNWAAYEAGIPQDSLIKPVWCVYKQLTLYGVHDIILVTGRNENSREATQRWLAASGVWDWKKLYMRKAGDYRPDDIVKREILDEIVADFGQKPDAVFEDRPRVVRMWRDNGIFVFDVNQSGEDF